MVVIDDAAVGANGDVDARFLKILVALGAHVDERRRLSAPDALRLTRDADGAAADADLDKVRTRIRKETEALSVDDVARADLDRISVLLADVLNRQALPLGESLGGVDAEDIHARSDERRHALGIVARIDARTDDVALVIIGQFELVLLVIGVVLAEHHVAQTLILINEREHVQLALPDEVVRLCEGRGVRIRPDELFKRRHKGVYLRIERHARDAIVAARHDADELAVRRAVLRDRHRGVPRLREEVEYAAERRVRADVGVTADKAGLVVFHARDHRRLFLDGLRAVDEGNAALFSERNRHCVIRDRLHDRGGHGNVHHERRLLVAMVFDERRPQRDICRETLRRGVARDEQILPKCVRWLGVVMCQRNPSFLYPS